MSDIFVHPIRNWMACKERLDVAKRECNEARASFRQASNQLLAAMKQHHVNELQTKSSNLVYRIRKRKHVYTEKQIMKKLNEFYAMKADIPNVVDDIQQYIDSIRPETEVEDIRDFKRSK